MGRFTDASQIGLQPNHESKREANGEWIGSPFSSDNSDWRDASAITHVDRSDSPILFMHSKDDSVVPWIQSRDMYRVMRDVGINSEIRIFETGGHGVRPLNEDPMEIMTSFFRKHL